MHRTSIALLLFVYINTGVASATSHNLSCVRAISKALSPDPIYSDSLIKDFSKRDQLPQTAIPASDWDRCCNEWGPKPILYPTVDAPSHYPQAQWKRDRIVAVAKKYIGLPYEHRHIPGMGGLDCSNFSSWVYNYGLGIGISSNVQTQAMTAGRMLEANEHRLPGDLLFIFNKDRTSISHVVIYINEDEIIDSTGPGVQVRKLAGWYKERFAWARRVIE